MAAEAPPKKWAAAWWSASCSSRCHASLHTSLVQPSPAVAARRSRHHGSSGSVAQRTCFRRTPREKTPFTPARPRVAQRTVAPAAGSSCSTPRASSCSQAGAVNGASSQQLQHPSGKLLPSRKSQPSAAAAAAAAAATAAALARPFRRRAEEQQPPRRLLRLRPNPTQQRRRQRLLRLARPPARLRVRRGGGGAPLRLEPLQRLSTRRHRVWRVSLLTPRRPAPPLRRVCKLQQRAAPPMLLRDRAAVEQESAFPQPRAVRRCGKGGTAGHGAASWCVWRG